MSYLLVDEQTKVRRYDISKHISYFSQNHRKSRADYTTVLNTILWYCPILLYCTMSSIFAVITMAMSNPLWDYSSFLHSLRKKSYCILYPRIIFRDFWPEGTYNFPMKKRSSREVISPAKKSSVHLFTRFVPRLQSCSRLKRQSPFYLTLLPICRQSRSKLGDKFSRQPVTRRLNIMRASQCFIL